MSVIALITDYGTRDWFAGCMKGVIANVAPHIPIVDITHDVPAGNIKAASFILNAAYKYFPPRSVFVAVVDPGVGTERDPIIAATRDYLFVGPNNGLFSFLVNNKSLVGAWRIENSMLFRQPVSNTFHGRDIFAPVGAYLARGGDVDDAGPRLPTENMVVIPAPEAASGSHLMRGEIVYVDHFGNAITAILGESIRRQFGDDTLRVTVDNTSIELNLSRCYGDVPKGAPCALLNSAGYLEIAVNGGNAKKMLGVEEGCVVSVERFTGR